jgi:membrane protein YdbS with pleckstrin-like domain
MVLQQTARVGRRAEPLPDSEQVVIRLRPHGRVLVVPAVVLVLVLGVAGFAAGRVPEGQYQAAGRWAVAALTVLVLARLVAVPWARWLSTRYVVTGRRVGVEGGVLRRHARWVPLSRVSDVGVERSLAQRALGSGTVWLSTVGDRGGLVLRDVPRARHVLADLEDLLDGLPLTDDDRYGGDRYGGDRYGDDPEDEETGDEDGADGR